MKYFKVPYTVFGEFEQKEAYIEAKSPDDAERKLMFYLAEKTEEPFDVDAITFGVVREIELIQ